MENNVRFGQKRAVPINVDETRTIDFVISDTSRDRHHTIFSSDGWDLTGYNKNPLVGYMHDVFGGGLCEGPDPDNVIGRGLVRQEGTELVSATTFEPADINPNAEKIFRKVIFGSLSSCSISFNELERGYWGQGDQAECGPDETYFIGKRELLEYSIVNIPSNRNAQKRSMIHSATGAMAYVSRELGDKFRLSQIEQMRVCDVLTLLEGKDVEIRSTDPDEVRRLLNEIEVLKRRNVTLEKNNLYFLKHKN